MKKRFKTKAQISVFIIISVVVVISIIMFFVFKNKVSNDEKQKIPFEIAPIYSFVENCIKNTGEEALFFIGQTGGYFNLPKESTSEYGIAYYLYNNKNLMPQKEKIEEEIGKYVDTNLNFCINDFKEFGDFKITQGTLRTQTNIEDDKVVFSIVYPLSITKEKDTYELNEFKDIEIDVRLDKVYDMANEMMKEQMYNTEQICIGCITNLAIERDLYIEMTNYDDNQTIVFTILDKNPKMNNYYFFSFANKYNKK